MTAREDMEQYDSGPVLGYQTICGVDGCDNVATHRLGKTCD